MDFKANTLLSQLRTGLVEGVERPNFTGGVQSGTVGIEEDVDAVDEYLAETTRMIIRDLGLDEEQATDFVLWLAEAAEQEGHLPQLPAMEATMAEIEEWLKAAEAVDFPVQALEVATEHLEQNKE